MNKAIFQSVSSLPAANAVNDAGGKAYSMGAKAGLAQFAATGTFNNTFYVTAEEQLKQSLDLVKQVDDTYLAKVAVYAREQRSMKDMPAFLLAVLSTRNPQLTERIFNRIITNGDMLRRFVQIIRSGAVGRKSLGSCLKRLIQNWLNLRDPKALVFDSVGNEPTLGDVVKLSHVRANTASHQAMFGYLIGKKPVEVVEDERNQVNLFQLPENLIHLEQYKNGKALDRGLPNVPFQMLTGLPLTKEDWTGIARNASWDMTRRNLNTFRRHGVLDDPQMVDLVASRLASKEEVEKNKNIFPYNLLITYLEMQSNPVIPMKIKLALQDALEHATKNVPAVDGKVAVFPDVSGSMRGASVTGQRKGATSVARAVHVAALVSATMLRVNPETIVVPFDDRVHDANSLNPRDSIMTNAEKLARFGGGGTNCALPLNFLNDRGIKADLVVYVSDNESWISDRRYLWARTHQETGVVHAWNRFKKANPRAKLVCIDTCPNTTVQAPDDKSILNVGGFSDSVFTTVANFFKGDGDHWVNEVERTEI